MSLPRVLNALLEDYSRNQLLNDLHDQHFALGIHPGEVLHLTQRPSSVPLRSGYLRPWRNLVAGNSGVSKFTSNKNQFKVNLDVQQFKPEELKIKVVDGYLVVDGKHEERSDEHGFISRSFTRRYKIPENANQEKLNSNLSSDGVLSISAPLIAKEEARGREIPIVQTNQPAVQKSTSSTQEQKGDKKEVQKMES